MYLPAGLIKISLLTIMNGILHLYSEYFQNVLDYIWNQSSFGLS